MKKESETQQSYGVGSLLHPLRQQPTVTKALPPARELGDLCGEEPVYFCP